MKPEEILENKIKRYFGESRISCKLRLLADNTIELGAMIEFAKQAFNASREEFNALYGPSGLKYSTFEDYLNSLEE